MAEQWERTITCKDALQRDRKLRVFLTQDDKGGVVVGLHTPPGDVAHLQPGGLAKLHDALTAARLEAMHRGAAWG